MKKQIIILVLLLTYSVSLSDNDAKDITSNQLEEPKRIISLLKDHFSSSYNTVPNSKLPLNTWNHIDWFLDDAGISSDSITVEKYYYKSKTI